MNKVTGRFFAPCRRNKETKQPSGLPRLFLRFLYGASLVGAATGFAGPEATRRQEGWKDRQKTAWIPLRSGRFEMQEKRPRDRGKGLTPAHRQRARTGGAGTAYPRSAAGADQRTPGSCFRFVSSCSRVQRFGVHRRHRRWQGARPMRYRTDRVKNKRDRFLAAPQNGRRRKAFSPFKGLRSAERKRKRTPLPTGEVRPSEHDNDF